MLESPPISGVYAHTVFDFLLLPPKILFWGVILPGFCLVVADISPVGRGSASVSCGTAWVYIYWRIQRRHRYGRAGSNCGIYGHDSQTGI
jgi:hypothetical protein